MIDHISVPVTDVAKSKIFYQRALAPLGIEVLMEFGPVVGFGIQGKPFFWIGGGRPDYWLLAHQAGVSPVHVAFQAKDREAVRAFHAAALAAGGKDHGAPGLRAQYHPSYYGAFVLDPDGNNIEAVCHLPG